MCACVGASVDACVDSCGVRVVCGSVRLCVCVHVCGVFVCVCVCVCVCGVFVCVCVCVCV